MTGIQRCWELKGRVTRMQPLCRWGCATDPWVMPEERHQIALALCLANMAVA